MAATAPATDASTSAQPALRAEQRDASLPTQDAQERATPSATDSAAPAPTAQPPSHTAPAAPAPAQTPTPADARAAALGALAGPSSQRPHRLSQPEFIEQLCQIAEEASERRAAEEAARDPTPQADVIPPSKRASLQERARRRNGSVSISRVGAETPDGSVPATPSRLSTIIMQNPQFTAYDANRSRESLASSSGAPEDEHVDAPEDTATQITQIPARSRAGTLSKAAAGVARRLSRANSRDALHGLVGGGESVVIGVRVQSATVHVLAEEVADAAAKPAVVVVTATATAGGEDGAPRELKRQRSKVSLRGKEWLRGIAARFRRKSSAGGGAPAVSAA